MVARLTNSSARFFLSLVLSRSVETSLTQAEFAIRPERGGFVPSITPPTTPIQVQSNQQNREKVYETHVVEGNTERITPPKQPALVPSLREEPEGDEAIPADPLEVCRRADKNASRPDQIAALIACWDEAFPVEEYPYQRLTVATAKKFLVNRTAEDVGQVILRVGALGHSDWPRTRVEKFLAGEDKRGSGGGEEEEGKASDELKEFTKMALEQWRKQNENRSGHKPGITR